MKAPKTFSGPLNVIVLDEADGMIAWSGRSKLLHFKDLLVRSRPL